MAALDTAQAQVALKYDPQQAALQRQIQGVQGLTAANEAGLNTYGTAGRQAIGGVYDTLNGLLSGNRQQSASDLANQVNLVGAGYDQANAYQQQVADAGQQRVNTLASQLNAGPAQVQAQSQLESTLANILGQNGQARANATGNLGTWASQWDQILGNGINIGEQSRAKASSDFETELLKLIGQNKVSGLEGENDLQGKLADILGSRQNDLISTYNQLSQQDWENAFRQAQLDQDAQEKNASLGLQSRGLDLQASGQAADNAYRNAQLSKSDQISPGDFLKMMLGQQSDAADRSQAQSDTNFSQQMALKQFGLDSLNSAADRVGKVPNGNNMLSQYLLQSTGAGNGIDPNELSQFGIALNTLGFPNSIAGMDQSGGGGNSNALLNALVNPASRSTAGPATNGNGGFSFNPAKWGSDFVSGMGTMFR